ncbi:MULTISPECIES: hypothetical protein [Rhizobium]|uniref:DUF4304 domain-containing protein n=1 Tax=Rhizobium tropici TaxID=398 RepID=A0A6P1C8U8_RHITR|nr:MULTISPECIES: hypothetical protein [Rhizobium]MBB4244330.1 hypothetical protein [Rhizobium tropici]MBB5595433.1 hypothetical protein [Rhizobium tropici]MBB6494669.1 hypothetical protein [Rhizobium tropici]NEV12816.1 hypothetical protein [Rhizobium tropici]
MDTANFISQFVEYFEEQGWFSQHGKRKNFWTVSRDFDGSSVRLVTNNRSVLAPTLNPKVRVGPFLTNALFSKIEKEIFQNKAKFQAVAYTEVAKAIPEHDEEYSELFKSILREIEIWGQNLNLQNCIHELAIKGVQMLAEVNYDI